MNTANSKSVNPFVLFIVFIACVIVALPMRVFQMMVNVEPSTGFWISRTHFSVFVLYAVAAVGVILPIVLSLVFKSGLGKIEAVPQKKTLGGVLSFLVTVGMLIDAVMRYMSFSDLFFDYQYNGAGEGVSMMNYLSKSGAIAMGLEAFFAVVSAIFFIMLGIAWLTGKDPSEYKLLAIMPVFWAIFRIMHRYMRKIAFLNISELFFELMMIVFLMMFFMAFAQVTAKVNGKGLEWKLYAYGLPAALFCLVCFVPRIVVALLGRADLIADGSDIEIIDLTVAAFILFVLVDRSNVFRKERKQKARVE